MLFGEMGEMGGLKRGRFGRALHFFSTKKGPKEESPNSLRGGAPSFFVGLYPLVN